MILEGAQVNAKDTLSVEAKQQVALVAVKDIESSDVSLETDEDFGMNSITTSQTNNSRTIGTTLKANNLKVSTNTLTLVGSQIKAQTATINAEVTKLIGEKNSQYQKDFSDTSNLLTRVVEDQGFLTETAVASTISASKLVFNGKDLNDPATQQLKNTLIANLSSEHDLSAQQITTLKATLENKTWHEKTTTLSKTGALIVQALTTALAPGVGGSVSKTFMDSAIRGMLNSLSNQLTNQLLTVAITGDSSNFNLKAITKNAIQAGLTSGITTKANGFIKNAKLGSITGRVAQNISDAAIKTAISGGSFEDHIIDAAIANTIGGKTAAGSFTNILSHAVAGCAIASARKEDCGSGAAGAALSAALAPQISKLVNPNGDKLTPNEAKQIKAISQMASMLLAGAAGKDVDTAFDAATNEVTNNYLDHEQQRLYARLLRSTWKECNGDLGCYDAKKSAIDQKAQALSDRMDAALKVAQKDCTENRNCAQVAKLLKEAGSKHSFNSRYQTEPDIRAPNPHLASLEYLGIAPIDQEKEWLLDQGLNQRKVNALLNRTLEEEVTGRKGYNYSDTGELQITEATFESAIDTTNGYVDTAKSLVDFLPVVGTAAGLAAATSKVDYAIELFSLIPGGKLLAKAKALKQDLKGADNLSETDLAHMTKELDDELNALNLDPLKFDTDAEAGAQLSFAFNDGPKSSDRGILVDSKEHNTANTVMMLDENVVPNNRLSSSIEGGFSPTGIDKFDQPFSQSSQFGKISAGLERRGITLVPDKSRLDAGERAFVQLDGNGKGVLVYDPDTTPFIDILHESRHVAQIQRAKKSGLLGEKSIYGTKLKPLFERGAYQYELRLGQRFGFDNSYNQQLVKRVNDYYTPEFESSLMRSQSRIGLFNVIEPSLSPRLNRSLLQQSVNSGQ